MNANRPTTRSANEDPGERLARLRKLAGLMLGTSVQRVAPHPRHGLDMFLIRRPGARAVPSWVDGELRLRVLTSAWRLDSPDRVVAASCDERDALERALSILMGKPVSALEITHPALDTTIGLGEMRLRIFPVSTLPLPEGEPAWTLRTARGVSLIVGPGGDWGMSGRRPKAREAVT
jgi:hypothetical protein